MECRSARICADSGIFLIISINLLYLFIKINESEKQIKIKFDDEKVAWYQYTDLDQIEHAYAITVHKAQRK